MTLDEIIALAAQDIATPLERARARRAVRHIRQEYDRRSAIGPAIICDVDVRDPSADDIDDVERLVRAAELAKLGTITWDRRLSRLAWSDEMTMIFGYAPGELRLSLSRLLALIHPDDRATVRRNIRTAWRDVTVTEVTYRVIGPDTATRYVTCDIEVLTDADGRPYAVIATGHDVTESELARQERDRLERRSRDIPADIRGWDAVTGLLTRSSFIDEIDRAQRTGTGTLLVLTASPITQRSAAQPDDDRLAAATADVMRQLARPSDSCALVGRHEFGVLMPYTTLDSAVAIAEEIVHGLRETAFMASSARLDANGGLVYYDHRNPIDSADLLVDGETAWRRARRADQSVYVSRQTPSADERRETGRARVRAAVAANRFTLFAQPLRDLALNRVTRHEILLRLLDDVGHAVAPSTFLELAERVDVTMPIDRWVIDNAMRLIGQGSQTAHFQINISSRSLADPTLLDHLRNAVKRHRVDPQKVTLEITETAIIDNFTQALRFAEGVRDLGCRLALDDFGVGYTSFVHLKHLPIDLVKIDGEFVRNLPTSSTDQTIVRSMVRMCRELGIRTAAEYVQDEATVDLLREYGVDFAQGYHIGRPELVAVGSRAPKSIELTLHPITSRNRTAM